MIFTHDYIYTESRKDILFIFARNYRCIHVIIIFKRAEGVVKRELDVLFAIRNLAQFHSTLYGPTLPYPMPWTFPTIRVKLLRNIEDGWTTVFRIDSSHPCTLFNNIVVRPFSSFFSKWDKKFSFLALCNKGTSNNVYFLKSLYPYEYNGF